MIDSTKSVSPLRQRMIEDMTMRKLNPMKQAGYLRAVKNFTRFYGRSPDLASAEVLHRFQLRWWLTGSARLLPETENATINNVQPTSESAYAIQLTGRFKRLDLPNHPARQNIPTEPTSNSHSSLQTHRKHRQRPRGFLP